MNVTKESKSVGEFIGSAFISYIATNIDDLVILMNFFTEASVSNAALKVRHIFIGQYLGFIILLGISLIGYALSYAIPVEMLGFLGFFPIFLGIKGTIEIILDKYRKYRRKQNDIIPNDQISTIELESIRYRDELTGDIQREITLQRDEQNEISIDQSPTSSNRWKERVIKLFSHCINIQTLKITSITVANSGDNVAIYTPLFAQALKWQIIVYILIYLVLVSVWLIISYFFINFRPILNLAQKIAHYAVPLVFIGIGIYIIITSDCFPWLVRAIRSKDFKNG